MTTVKQIQKAMAGEEKWALVYLMKEDNWQRNFPLGLNDPRFVNGTAVFPQIHGFYDTEKEAREIAGSKGGHPNAYTVCQMRNYTGSGI